MKKLIILLGICYSGKFLSQPKTIHVFVALCDNKNQGIVPVPEKIGNGQNAGTNLYWGAAFGVKNFLAKKSGQWILLKTEKNPEKGILERILFKHKTANVYLLADAYDGIKIEKTINNFFMASGGDNSIEIKQDSLTLYFGGGANLIAYVGHNGLMDFSLTNAYKKKNEQKRETIILACFSKKYFTSHLKETGAYPLLWSSGLMSPEAYTLDAAIQAWIANKPKDEIRLKAAEAYHAYQKCGLKGAKNLLLTGW